MDAHQQRQSAAFVDLSRRALDVFTGDSDEDKVFLKSALKGLNLSRNVLTALPNLIQFSSLVELDISNNQVAFVADEIVQLRHLRTLIAKNNLINHDSLPKNFGDCPSLEVLNVSGNSFVDFPLQVTELQKLKELYIGSNFITDVPREIRHLKSSLEVLYLGGNAISELPVEIGELKQLLSLALSDNKLESLPSELTELTNLQSLSLHNNQLTTFPPHIITLSNLCALSLRGNPLVVRFVRDFAWQPPTLLELSARVVKNQHLMYSPSDLPVNLFMYLNEAKKCVNPACEGVYFNSRVENIKFVDFCGKYRLPLMQYLCSPQCRTSSHSSSSSESESEDDDNRIKKVLLG